MSVQKISKNPNYLKRQKKPFEMIYRQILDKLQNAHALAVYCHLSGKSDNWEINDQYIMNHFKWGRDKARDAMNCLIVNKLINRIQLIDEKGKFAGRLTELLDGYDFDTYIEYDNKIHKNLCEYRKLKELSTENYPSPEEPSDGPAVDGKQAAKEEDIKSFKEEERESTVRAKRVPLSENFNPDQQRKAKSKTVSQRCGIPEDELLNKFIAIQKSTGKKAADWQAEFELFLLREKPNIKKSPLESKPNQEIKSTVPFWEPGNPDYDRANGISKGIDNGLRNPPSNNHRLESVRKSTEYLLQGRSLD